jgi:hypothetical protein
MKYKNKIISIIIILLLIVYSCEEKSTLPPIDLKYEYFPVNTGKWIIYDVDSISYNDFTLDTDTFVFQIKEYIESSFIDNSNKNTQRIERYKRNNDTLNWSIKDVWYCNLNNTTAEKVEEDVRFVKLVFPVIISKKWDGNIYNTYESQTYKYIDVDVPYSINGITFDSTLTVLQKNITTLISEDYSIEVYAKNTGMIYKKFIHLEKEITGDIKKGVDYSYTINSYGN